MLYQKRGLLVFVCMFFLLSGTAAFALGDGEIIFEDYVFEQDTLLIDDSLPVTVVLTPDKAKITLNGEIYLLDYHSTVDTTYYTVSITDYDEDRCNGIIDQGYCKIRSETLTGTEALTKLTIRKRVAELEVSYAVEDEDFFVGSKKRITVTFENTGDLDVVDISFSDEYPWDLFLGNPSHGQVIDNTFKFTKSTLRSGDTFSVSFIMHILKPSDTIQAGSLEYSDGLSKTVETIEPIHIETKNPLSFDIIYTEKYGDEVKPPFVDELYEFDLIVTNNVGTAFTVPDLLIEFPVEFNISDFDLEVQDGVSTHSGLISIEKIFSGDVRLHADSLPVVFSYTYDGDYYRDELEEIVQFTDDDEKTIKPVFTYSTTHEGVYIPGNAENVHVTVFNDGEVVLEDITGTVSSGILEGGSFFIDELFPGKSVVLFDESFIVPDVSEERTYDITSELTYVALDETYLVSNEMSIRVIPLLEAVSVSHEVVTISEYERAITGSVTSKLEYNVKLDIELLHALGRNFISDSQQYATLATKLEPLEEKKLLSYRVFLPYGVSETIQTSFWVGNILAQDSFDLTIGSASSTAGDGLDIAVSYPLTSTVGKKEKVIITFENPSTETKYDHIVLDFIPSPTISVESFGRAKITALVPTELYTYEIPFTVLQPGNDSLGSVQISYFADDGTPFLFQEADLPFDVEGTPTKHTLQAYVGAEVSLLEKAGVDEVIQIILTNPHTSVLTGTFEIANKTIDFTLEGEEVKDYYYTISHIEASGIQSTGFPVVVESADKSKSTQIFSVSETALPDSGTIIQSETNSQTGESTVVLVSQEDSYLSDETRNTAILAIIVFVGAILFIWALVNIYKKKRKLRI